MKPLLQRINKEGAGAIAALAIVLLSFVYLFLITFVDVAASDNNLTESRTIVGAVFMIAVNYLVGSSRSSQMKDDTIKELSNQQTKSETT